jgi:hypothetical protein
MEVRFVKRAMRGLPSAANRHQKAEMLTSEGRMPEAC